MSDTVSLTSEDALVSGSSSASAFIELEDVGKFSLGDAVGNQAIKRIVLVDALFAALLEEGIVVLGELRANKGSKDWVLHAKSACTPPGTNIQGGGRYLDLALIRNSGENKNTLVLLGERKNKERFLAAHNITQSARFFEIGDELSVYDKSNVLGKLTSHLAACHDMEAVFTVSNLVRKIKVEESTLRPTTARAQIPNECQDGTLGVCVLPGSTSKKAASKGNYVVLALRTKSASGKNKYAIEWYSCNKKDELASIKGSTLKLHEDSEPVAVLSDPKDSRSIFTIYNNKAQRSSNLHKLSKSSSAGPLISWDFNVAHATLGWVAESLVIAILPENGPSNQIRVFVVHKTDGFRSRHPGCANCRPLEDVPSPAHVISCAASKWQLQASVLDDIVLGSKSSTNVLLASLCLPDGSLAMEPDSGLPYRVRIVGCPVRGLHPEAILLEDIDRIFDGDVSTLSGYILKICISSRPCQGCYSLLSTWVKADKIAAIELFFASNSNNGVCDDLKESERFTISSISQDKFRIYISDVDWTQQMKHRPQTAFVESTGGGGTFTFETDENGKTSLPHRPMSASVCSNSSRVSGSKIPTPKSASLASSMRSAHEHDEEDLEEANQRLRALVQKMAATLSVILDVDVALRNNLINLNSTVSEIQDEMRMHNY